MLSRKPDPPRDPDEVVRGKCATCGTVVECRRADLVSNPPQIGPNRNASHWDDLAYCTCPRCGSRVYPLARSQGG